MCPLRYYTMLRQSKDRTYLRFEPPLTRPRIKRRRACKDRTYLRFELVRYARANGIKATARHFSTTVKTVRKWLRRWRPGSLQGLQDLSRAPHHPRQGITARQRQQAITLKQRLPSWGATRIKRDFTLSLSTKALCRIWRTEGLLKRKRREHKTKQNLRAVKREWRLFEQTCLDTTDLKDIPELWPQIEQHRLPLVQYTAREVTSGWQFVAYAQERCLAYSKLFAEIILEHLQKCGVRFKGSRFQSDNGNEFVGSWQAKADSEFTKAVESVRGLRHHRIPPRAHRWQSDVETVHRLIEDEFYEVEQFTSRADFLSKARVYNLWFNVARKNSYKENQTPWQIIHAREPQVSAGICALPPVFLDELFMKKLDAKLRWGYDLIHLPYLMFHPKGSNARINPGGRIISSLQVLRMKIKLHPLGFNELLDRPQVASRSIALLAHEPPPSGGF